jgi:hypothetical protein
MGKKNRKPIFTETPTTQKVPRGLEKNVNTEITPISWKIGILDKAGPYSWTSCTQEEFWEYIKPRLINYEKMTWQEIFQHDKNHPIKISIIESEAQQRLRELKFDDIEELVSLGITKLARIWGIKDGSCLKILWWDPNHHVCPSHKKYT